MSEDHVSSDMLHSSQRLKGSANYSVWQNDVKDLLEAKDLLDTILPSFEEPKLAKPARTDLTGKAAVESKGTQDLKEDDVKDRSADALEQPTGTEAEIAAWKKQAVKARIIINKNLDKEPKGLVSGVRNPSEIWKILRDQYHGKGWNIEEQTFSKLVQIDYKDFNSMTTFIVEFKKLYQDLQQLDSPLSERHATFAFLNATEGAFPIWADRQRAQGRDKKSAPSLEDLMSDIQDEARKLENDSSGSSFFAGKDSQKKSKDSKKSNDSKKDSKKCEVCGVKGHVKSKCWVEHSELAPDWWKAKQDDKGTPNKGSKTAKPYVMMTSRGVSKSDWIVDTGATDHMCNSRDLFSKLDLIEDMPIILTASGQTRPAGIGTVKLAVDSNFGVRELVLRRVFYMPDILCNLFSALQLLCDGGTIDARNGGLFDKEDINIATIDTSKDGLLLRVLSQGPSIRTALAAFQSPRKQTRRVMHLRLGHRSAECVENTVKSTSGIILDESPSGVSVLCRDCLTGNITQDISRVPRPEPEHCLDEISFDMIGPITPTGFNGHRWATMATDRKSRVRWIKTHKTKAEAQICLRDFLVMFETQYSCRVKFIDLDGGKEFGVSTLQDLGRQKGFIVRMTAPYSSRENGMSERGFRVITSSLRACFEYSHAPTTLWPEMIVGQVHTTNRTASSVLGDRTPYEVFAMDILGRKNKNPPPPGDSTYLPDISHLRILGGNVIVHIPEERRQKGAKFESRGDPGILVGYDGNYIYRCWVKGRRDIVRSTSVRFEEGSEGGISGESTPEFDFPDLLDEPEKVDFPSRDTPGSRNEAIPEMPELEKSSENASISTDDSPGDVDQDTIVVDHPGDPDPEISSGESEDITPRARGRGSRMLAGIDTAVDPNAPRATRHQGKPSTTALISLLLKDPEEPATYAQAKKFSKSDDWLAAMDRELKTLEDNDTWKVVPKPQKARVLRGEWR